MIPYRNPGKDNNIAIYDILSSDFRPLLKLKLSTPLQSSEICHSLNIELNLMCRSHTYDAYLDNYNNLNKDIRPFRKF